VQVPCEQRKEAHLYHGVIIARRLQARCGDGETLLEPEVVEVDPPCVAWRKHGHYLRILAFVLGLLHERDKADNVSC
jgi:hypothetical protein